MVEAGELDLAMVAMESDLGDLKGEDVILLADGHCLRAQALAICDSAGACDPGAMRATSLATLVQMAGAGVGITVLLVMTVNAGHHRGDGLCLVRFGAPVPN